MNLCVSAALWTNDELYHLHCESILSRLMTTVAVYKEQDPMNTYLYLHQSNTEASSSNSESMMSNC